MSKCNCLEQTEKAYPAMAAETQDRIQPAKGYRIKSATCESLKLCIGNNRLHRGFFVQFKLRWECEGKKPRNTESNVAAKFCPMCGGEL